MQRMQILPILLRTKLIMKKYRITFQKLNKQGMHEIVFTTIVFSKSIRGASQKARNLRPFEWSVETITSLESEWNLKLDKLEFNY